MNGFFPSETTLADVRDRAGMRLLVACCQGASILLTWPLWKVRVGSDAPPNLPLFDLALLDRLQVPLGETLLLTLVMAVLWPRLGTLLHAVVLGAAILLDQLRIQPEFVSLAILLAGTLPRRGLLLLARCHAISLWVWAGVHKLLSPEYLLVTGPDLVQGAFADLPPRAAIAVGAAMAILELTLGVAAILPPTRRLVPVLAALLHGGVLLMLAGRGWNTAVWPWNIALAAAGFALFPRRGQPFWTWDETQSPPLPSQAGVRPALSISGPLAVRLWRGVALAVLCYPALYYVNLCDGYLAWCVYSSNTPDAVIYDQAHPAGERLFDRAYRPMNVPFSPAVRLYEQYFRRVGQVDDRLEIDDPRPLSRLLGRGTRTLLMTDEGAVELWK